MSRSEIVGTGVAWSLLGFLVFCVPAFFIPDAWPWYVRMPLIVFLGFAFAMWLRRGFEFAIEDAVKGCDGIYLFAAQKYATEVFMRRYAEECPDAEAQRVGAWIEAAKKAVDEHPVAGPALRAVRLTELEPGVLSVSSSPQAKSTEVKS